MIITSSESSQPVSLLFTLTLLQEGVVMTDAVLSYKGKHYVSTVIENQNMHPVWLEEDLILGQMEPVDKLGGRM